MCGITGFFDLNCSRDEQRRIVDGMTQTLKSRGPDAMGSWIHPQLPLAFGHRRLSIVDLSETGAQPMTSQSGRSTLVLNGEIYNFRTLRSDLEKEGVRFRGSSDTEVLLEAMERWGFASTLKKTVGMFALAWWDESQRSLWLARDRMGEKPLYFMQDEAERFLFGSELKALRFHPAFKGEIDEGARNAYFRYGYIPSDATIYRGVEKLSPGSFLRIDFRSGRPQLSREKFWDIDEAFRSARTRPFSGSFADAVRQAEDLIKTSIAQQRVADVPVGAFLSGGIDSSTIVALLQENSSVPVQTFTVGFQESDFDEAIYAREVAKHLGTQHHECRLSASDALKMIPDLGWHYDEPFSDSSQIPTLLVSQFARSRVTVSMSGDAGDEIFGGYNRYLWGPRIRSATKWIPGSVRRPLGRWLHDHHETMGKLYVQSSGWLNRSAQVAQASDKFRKLGLVLSSSEPQKLYERVIQTHDETEVLLRPGPLTSLKSTPESIRGSLNYAEEMMLLDLMNYLPGDILTKLDRASMAVSLESRVPFLDHRLVEWSWSLPVDFKIRNGKGKVILREILRSRVPDALMDRPKVGFGIPLGKWLRNEWKDWAQQTWSQLDRHRDVLDVKKIRALWDEHLRGPVDHGHRLWNVLMYLQWDSSQKGVQK